jgi:HAD superfamily hydrolase (TIGR01509 family)
MTQLQGVLLDIDGTLLLSNRDHAQAWVDAYAEFGYDVALDKVEPLVGMGGDKVMSLLTPGLNKEEGVGKQIDERRKEIFLQRYAPSLQPSPGARELVLRMKAEGLQITIATSASNQELKTLLEAAQVDDLTEVTTTSSDAEQSKPDPDIVAAALEKSDKTADQVLMLGDTPYDVESAGKIGVGVVAVRCGGHSDEDLAGALAIYDDPADLLAHYDESPLAQRAHAVSAAGE